MMDKTEKRAEGKKERERERETLDIDGRLPLP